MFILDSLAASPISAPAVLTFSSLKSYNVRIWTFVGTAWWSSGYDSVPFTAEDPASIPGAGTKILQAAGQSTKQNENLDFWRTAQLFLLHQMQQLPVGVKDH